VVDDAGIRQDAEVFVVRALIPALDELVAQLVRSGIAVRELAPVVSPLEAAFLALTDQQQQEQQQQEQQQQEAGR
jgi:ABC-2 type transport system ATP-binding protein